MVRFTSEAARATGNHQTEQKTRTAAAPHAINFHERGLTRRQAASMTGYSEKTLANYSTLAIGPPFRKHRNRTIYIESELRAWLMSLPEAGGVPVA